MPFPIEHFPPPPEKNPTERPAQVRHYDLTWNRPIFRAPSLPTTAQLWSEVPFTAHFPHRSFSGKARST